MKKNIFKRITNLTLSTIFAMSMLSSTAFAQENVVGAEFEVPAEIQAYEGRLSEDSLLRLETNLGKLIEPMETISISTPFELSSEYDNSMAVSMEVDVVDNVSNTIEIRNDNDLLNLLDSDLSVDENGISTFRTTTPEHLLQDPNTPQTFAQIATFNTDPNNAIYLPSSYFGFELSDVANHQERWYAFSVPVNNKISITMQHFDGDYDLMLFELVGNSLNLVDYAATYNPLERISYVSKTGGTYYLAAVPYALSTQNYFVFIVDVLSNFDSFEANDFYYQAPTFNNSIDVSANIDNGFDQDWFKLNVTTSGVRGLAALNAPAGHYAVSIYDHNLNLLGSFMADNMPRNMNFAVGTYYLQVESLTGRRDCTRL